MDWSSKRVFVTGHTGFKGAWLTQWLIDLGAQVAGYSLAPNTQPSLYKQLKLETSIKHQIGDIRDFQTLKKALKDFKPNVIFHLAAQALVRPSYETPIETWDSNVQGTLHLLEAVRQLEHPCSIIAVTTDKVYENLETGQAYKETDRLGGYDPYSASKAATELLIHSYRQSFFKKDTGIHLASARAGNVIGGGDWSKDRIIPDIIRALSSNEPIEIRSPKATRPWQHVLDPLAGYMRLAEALTTSHQSHEAYNFGPDPEGQRSVEDVVNGALQIWPGEWVDQSSPGQLHEANLLSLSIEKAKKDLSWSPVWNFETALQKTILWYKSVREGLEPREITRAQIAEFMQ